jgi:hypothetical protein
MSGRWVIQSRNQWLTTSATISTKVRLKADATYGRGAARCGASGFSRTTSAANRIPHTTSNSNECEYG